MLITTESQINAGPYDLADSMALGSTVMKAMGNFDSFVDLEETG